MQLEAKALEDPFVKLEPLGESHKRELRAACNADTHVWSAIYPFSWAGEHFDPTWDRVVADVSAGLWIAFAVMVHGRCQGITCYLTIEAQHGGVEIGATYYHPDYRGGATNPAAKRLLVGHALACGARRVVFRVDAINECSRDAVSKLGVVKEGIMRADRVTWTGPVRDTVVFSVLSGEWPALHSNLDARLERLAAIAQDQAHKANPAQHQGPAGRLWDARGERDVVE